MKRFALSLVAGITIPIVYTLIVGPLSRHIENRMLNQCLGYPVRWPIIILRLLFPTNLPNSELLLLLIIFVCNVILYAGMTYGLLLTLSKPKAVTHLPPPPPQE